MCLATLLSSGGAGAEDLEPFGPESFPGVEAALAGAHAHHLTIPSYTNAELARMTNEVRPSAGFRSGSCWRDALVIYGATKLADLLSTEYFLAHGWSEANPLMQKRGVRIAVAGILGPVTFAAIDCALLGGKVSKGERRILRGVVVGAHALVVTRNMLGAESWCAAPGRVVDGVCDYGHFPQVEPR